MLLLCVCILGENVFRGCFHNVMDCGPWIRFFLATLIFGFLIIVTVFIAKQDKKMWIWGTIWAANTSNATALAISLIPIICHDEHKVGVKLSSILLMAIICIEFTFSGEVETAVAIGFTVAYIIAEWIITLFVCTEEHRNDVKRWWASMDISRNPRCCWSTPQIEAAEDVEAGQHLIEVPPTR